MLKDDRWETVGVMVKTVKDACEELGANAVDCVLPRISTVLRRCAEYVADSGAELGCRVGTAWSVPTRL